jgi:transglutaminase-like putative cysteine protease
MRVEFPEEPDGVYVPADQLYWRVTTLSRFSGSEWSRVGLQDHLVPGVAAIYGTTAASIQSAGKEEGRARREGARLVRQVIFMDDMPTSALPCLDLVQSVRLPEETKRMSVHWDANLDFTVQLETRGPRRLSYEAFSEVVQPPDSLLRAAGWEYGANLKPHDLQTLTYHELLPETRQLVETVVQGRQSPYEVMQALEAWLSGRDFLYTLDLPPLPARNGIDYFLTRTRRGHCELFASALALMARSRGIPARVVSGYRGGDLSPIDRAYSVRASMAHLWVEAYFNGLGWVRFDPSPQTDLDTTRLGTLRAAISRQILRGKMFWYQSVMGFQGGWRLDRLFRRGGGDGMMPQLSGIADSGAAALWWLPRGAAAIPVVIAGVALLLLLRLRRSRRRGKVFPLTPDQTRAVRLHHGLVRRLERLGIPCSGRVVEEIAEAVRNCSWLDRETVLKVIGAYNEVRFGGRPMNRAQYAALRRALSGVRILR